MLLAGCGADESAERSASASAAGIVTVRIVGETGTVEVTGEPGRTSVAAEGTAYATSRARLDDIVFRITTIGQEMTVDKGPGLNSCLTSVRSGKRRAIVTGTGDVTIRDGRRQRHSARGMISPVAGMSWRPTGTGHVRPERRRPSSARRGHRQCHVATAGWCLLPRHRRVDIGRSVTSIGQIGTETSPLMMNGAVTIGGPTATLMWRIVGGDLTLGGSAPARRRD
jgi:hypothetical protein